MALKNNDETADILDRIIAATSGKDDLLDVLKREHREAAALLDEILETEEVAKRSALFKKLRPALLSHLHGEEAVFYPLLKRQGKKVKTDAIEGFVEHHLAKGLINKLDHMSGKTSAEWTARCKVLKELVAHHVKEEESTIWKDARKHLGPSKLEQLVAPYQQAKKKFLDRR
jgi:hypothetical protein